MLDLFLVSSSPEPNKTTESSQVGSSLLTSEQEGRNEKKRERSLQKANVSEYRGVVVVEFDDVVQVKSSPSDQ